IQQGESITTGPNAGKKTNWVTKDIVKKLSEKFKNVSQVMRLITDHTLSINYIFPDPKVFSPEKYQKVEERILRWGGVPDVLMTGSGEGFSQGSLGKQRFEAHGLHV